MKKNIKISETNTLLNNGLKFCNYFAIIGNVILIVILIIVIFFLYYDYKSYRETTAKIISIKNNEF